MGTFVKLNCANCGGDLEVYDDVQQFACGHCGAPMEVQRRGGTIALRVLAGAKPGTEPGAATLVLGRLKEEAANLCKRREAMLSNRTSRKRWGYTIGIAFLVIGFLVVRMGSGFAAGLGLMMAGILTISYIRRSDRKVSADMRELQAKIHVIDGRIEDHGYQSKSS